MNSASISDTEAKVLTYHRIAEAFKYAYSKRTLLADEDFANITEVRKTFLTIPWADSIDRWHRKGKTTMVLKTLGL